METSGPVLQGVRDKWQTVPVLIAVDGSRPRNKKDDIQFLSQRTGLGNLVLGWQFFPTSIFFFFYLFIFLIEG